MLLSLWRMCWGRKPGPSRWKGRVGTRHISHRPQLEPLEDRMAPALAASGALGLVAEPLAPAAPLQVAAAAPSPAVGLPTGTKSATPSNQTLLQVAAATASPVGGVPTAPKPPMPSNHMSVIVSQNSPESVIDLGAVFGAMGEIHPKDGLQLSILGNSNSGLVTTDLSGADLTLTYAHGKWGTATITVGATDADGMSVREVVLVTVTPLPPPGGPIPAASQAA